MLYVHIYMCYIIYYIPIYMFWMKIIVKLSTETWWPGYEI